MQVSFLYSLGPAWSLSITQEATGTELEAPQFAMGNPKPGWAWALAQASRRAVSVPRASCWVGSVWLRQQQAFLYLGPTNEILSVKLYDACSRNHERIKLRLTQLQSKCKHSLTPAPPPRPFHSAWVHPPVFSGHMCSFKRSAPTVNSVGQRLEFIKANYCSSFFFFQLGVFHFKLSWENNS